MRGGGGPYMEEVVHEGRRWPRRGGGGPCRVGVVHAGRRWSMQGGGGLCGEEVLQEGRRCSMQEGKVHVEWRGPCGAAALWWSTATYKPIMLLMQQWSLHLRSTTWRWSLKAPAMSYGLLQPPQPQAEPERPEQSLAKVVAFRKGKATS